MNETRSATETLIDRYIAIWNETDPTRRQALIAQVWAENCSYRDPALEGNGRDGIEAMTAGFQAAYPGHTFARLGEAEMHGNELRFGWSLENVAGETQMTGSDVAIVGDDGLLQSIVGTFDSPVPTDG